MTIPLEDNRRVLTDWIGKIQHLVAGIPLLFLGIGHFRHEGEETKSLACVEVALAATLLFFFLSELRVSIRRLRGLHTGNHHSRIGWFDLAAGGLLLFETFHGVHYKPFYERARFYSAGVALAIGFFHGALTTIKQRRRFLTIDEDGFEIQTGPKSHVKAKWSDLQSAHWQNHSITFTYMDSRTERVAFLHIGNRAEAKAAFTSYAEAAKKLLTLPEST